MPLFLSTRRNAFELHVVVVDGRAGLARQAAFLGEHAPEPLLGAEAPDPVLTDCEAGPAQLVGDEPVAERGVVPVRVPGGVALGSRSGGAGLSTRDTTG